MLSPFQSDSLLTTTDLAAARDCSTSYARRLCRTGKVPAVKVGSWRIPAVVLSTLAATVSAHSRRAVSEPSLTLQETDTGRGVGPEHRALGSRSESLKKEKGKDEIESFHAVPLIGQPVDSLK